VRNEHLFCSRVRGNGAANETKKREKKNAPESYWKQPG